MILWGGFQIFWEMIQVDFGWWGFLLGDFRSGGLHGAEKKDGRDEVDFFGVCLVSGKQFLFGNRKFWLGIFRSKTNYFFFCFGSRGFAWRDMMGAHRGMIQYTKTGG